MSSILFFLAWTITGSTLAIALAEPDERRAAWVPYGLILGPLWAAVAMDRRANRPSVRPSATTGLADEASTEWSPALPPEPVLAGVGS